MNLKTAAHELDVHYQTAYRWVRAGELTAVRIGARYDISDAAIHQFIANRTAVWSAVKSPAHDRRVTDLTRDDVLAELDAMTTDPLVAATAVAALVARRGAEVLGDLCFVMHTDEDGQQVVVDHPQPTRAAFVRGALRATDDCQTMVPGMAQAAYHTGRAVRVDHVARDRLRSSTRPELRQYLTSDSMCSLLAVPVSVAGTKRGLIAFTRDAARHPYLATDEAFAVQLSTRLGWLFETAREIALAWQIRSSLAQSLEMHNASRGMRRVPDRTELDQLIRDCPHSGELPVAILGADHRYLTANQKFLRIAGSALDAVVGTSCESSVAAADVDGERTNVDRLVTGELDYIDHHAHRALADGTHRDYASHRVAVRGLDATLQCIITINRPIHTGGSNGDEADPAGPSSDSGRAAGPLRDAEPALV